MSNGQVNGHTGKHNEGYEAPTRRNVLRRTGIIGAVTAAFIGGADLVGIPAFASATAKSNRQRPDGDPGVCTWAPGHCNNGHACPAGECCYHCVCGTRTSTACGPAVGPGCRSYEINC
jgi:hypothetical protein